MSFTITGGEYNTGGTDQFPTIEGYSGVIYITSGSGNIQLNGITIKDIFLVGGGAGGTNGSVRKPGNGGGYYYPEIVNLSETSYDFSVGEGGASQTNGNNTIFDNITALGGVGLANSAYSGYVSVNNLYYGGSGGFGGTSGNNGENAHVGGGGGGGGSGSTNGGTGGGISSNLYGGSGGSRDQNGYGTQGGSSYYGGGGGGGGGFNYAIYTSLGGGYGGSGNDSGNGGSGGSGGIYGGAGGGGGGGGGGKNTGGGGGGGGDGGSDGIGGGGGSGIIILLYDIAPPLDPTGYIVNNDNYTANTDLKDIFKQGNSGITTNYKLQNGDDLGTVFAAYASGTKASSVSYSVNSQDLSEIFAPISYGLEYSLTGTYTDAPGTINNVQYDHIITFTGNGTFNVTTLPSNIIVNYFMVGPGGSGGYGQYAFNWTYTTGSGGGGGGGGEVKQGLINVTTNTNYQILLTPNTTISDGNLNIQAYAGENGYSTSIGGTSGSGYAPGAVNTPPATQTLYYRNGGGGGGDTSDGNNEYGGSGFTFNGLTYGVGGMGGNYSSIAGVSGGNNTGNGGGGGSGSGSSSSSSTAYDGSTSNSPENDPNAPGGAGGSGIVILYFNDP